MKVFQMIEKGTFETFPKDISTHGKYFKQNETFVDTGKSRGVYCVHNMENIQNQCLHLGEGAGSEYSVKMFENI